MRLVLLLLAVACHAQEPLGIVKAFFAPEGIKDKAAVYTGEMLSSINRATMGEYLGKGVEKEYRELHAGDSAARFAVTFPFRGRVTDYYAFLKKEDGRWKLAAIRTLAQTELVAVSVRLLNLKKTRTAKEEWDLKNGQLTLASDAELRTALLANIGKLDRIVALFQQGKKDEATAAAKEQHISSMESAKQGSFRLTIGGITDNTVGFLWVPKGSAPPPVDAEEVIYLENVTDRWFVFKTT